MFLKETWTLVHKGLIKSCHAEEGNKFALKGSLVFNKNIRKNSIHAERFYVRHTTFDRDHALNRVLYKTLNLITHLAISPETLTDVQVLLIYFPELKDIRVNIRSQAKKTFWTGSTGDMVRQKPDIVIEVDRVPKFILDTKWKVINNKPSEDDLRQMFAYNKLFGTLQSYLIYPGEYRAVQGEFYDIEKNGTCALRFIPFLKEGRLSHYAIDYFLDELLKS